MNVEAILHFNLFRSLSSYGYKVNSLRPIIIGLRYINNTSTSIFEILLYHCFTWIIFLTIKHHIFPPHLQLGSTIPPGRKHAGRLAL